MGILTLSDTEIKDIQRVIAVVEQFCPMEFNLSPSYPCETGDYENSISDCVECWKNVIHDRALDIQLQRYKGKRES